MTGSQRAWGRRTVWVTVLVVFFGIICLVAFLLQRSFRLPTTHATVNSLGTGVSRQAMTSSAAVGSSTPNSSDTEWITRDLKAVSNKEYKEMMELLDARERLPVHPWHKERVENIKGESVEEVVDNLANFDDMHFAATGSGREFSLSNPESINYLVSHLFRARKLLEVAQTNRNLVVRTMEKSILETLENWPKAFKEELALWDNSPTMNLRKSKPTTHDQLRVRAAVATYLLAELSSHDSLPLLLKCYKIQGKWIAAIPEQKYRFIPQCPVPPATTLFAMHRLVSTLPRGQLTPQGSEALDEYIGWAEKHVPRSKSYLGVKSDAMYDESDPAVRKMDPEGILIKHQPKMALLEYPTTFTDGARMQRYPAAPYITDRSREWLKLMEAVIELAFNKEPSQTH